MLKSRRIRLLLAAVPAALLATSFTGCGLAEDAAKNKAEDALEDEGLNADLDDLENGNIEIEGTDGSITTGKLPKGFPTDEVPVVEGEILAGSSTKSPDSWTVTIKVGPAGGDKGAAYDDADEILVGADAENVTPKTDNGTGIFGQYATASYVVDLSSTDSNGIVITYVVTPK